MPVRMPDGRVIYFPAPSFVAFYLLEAKRHLDRGTRLRSRALSVLRTAHDGKLLITDKQAVLDCFAEITKAVLLSYSAIEALVNEMIESLDDTVTITHANSRGVENDIGKTEIVRRLSTPDKLHTVIPMVTGEPSVKGTVYWEHFVRLRRLRDTLVHVKEGNYSSAPDDPSTYGALLRGDADSCVLDACALTTKLDPSRLSEAARKALKIPTVGSASTPADNVSSLS
jgi:hypothetical protein